MASALSGRSRQDTSISVCCWLPTERGTEVAASIWADSGSDADRVFDRLSPADRDDLARILRTLLDD
jgi:hypothetical protein